MILKINQILKRNVPSQVSHMAQKQQFCARHVIYFLVEIFIGWFWFMHLFIWIFNDSSCMFFKTNKAQAEKTN